MTERGTGGEAIVKLSRLFMFHKAEDFEDIVLQRFNLVKHLEAGLL